MSDYSIVLNPSAVYTTIGQAASALLVNRATVRRWLRDGNLRGARIGRTTLILKADVLNFALQRGISIQDLNYE